MPRGRKAANGADHDGPEQAAPEGHNGPSDALILEYARNIIRKDVEIEETRDELKSLVGQRRSQVKAAKKAGIPTVALLRAIAQRHMDQDEIIANEREWVRMRALLGMPVEQTELFPDIVASSLDDEERRKQAIFGIEQMGYLAGKSGQPIEDNPFHQSLESEQFTVWARHWHKGQARLARGLTPPKPPKRTDRAATKEPETALERDEAAYRNGDAHADAATMPADPV
jgi:hypothetical protein